MTTREQNRHIAAARKIIVDAADKAGIVKKIAGRLASFAFLDADAILIAIALAHRTSVKARSRFPPNRTSWIGFGRML